MIAAQGSVHADLAGFLASCVLGFTGVRIGPFETASWPVRAPAFPEGWDGIEVERLVLRGRDAHLVARHGDERATLEVD